jgi:hypothetical protein
MAPMRLRRDHAANTQGAAMAKAIGLIVVLALSACSGMPPAQFSDDPCRTLGETSIPCQDYRYARAP